MTNGFCCGFYDEDGEWIDADMLLGSGLAPRKAPAPAKDDASKASAATPVPAPVPVPGDPDFDPANFNINSIPLDSGIVDASAERVLSEFASQVRAVHEAPPDGLIDEALLCHPASFGDELRPVLESVREFVLADADESTRSRLQTAPSARGDDRAIGRVRRILDRRPNAAERASPALVQLAGDRLVVALTHAVPGAGERLAVRLQVSSHPEVVSMAAKRLKEIPSRLEPHWAALGHRSAPYSIWSCEPPSWCEGAHQLAIELMPNPSSFNHAMYIAHFGAARVLVTTPPTDPAWEDAGVSGARVLPSGWSYLRGDRSMGATAPAFPNGAPLPASVVRVRDPDLFALCAAKTWAVSLRDAIWLRNRAELRAIE